MSQSERLSRIANETKRYVSRSKTRDSSELTHIHQAKASKVESPQIVQSAGLKVDAYGGTTAYSTIVTIQGKGTNKEYLNVLQRKEGCAVCDDTVGTDVLPGFYIATPCYDRTKAPFSPLSVLSTASYKPTCSVPDPIQYFPPFVERGKTNNYKEQGVHDPANTGTTVKYQHLPLPSG